ncbi:MAG: DUF4404 family protein [Planctomycetota bacterium]|nr:DUF4404 family protein [Planctomycetota bacterium]
MTATREQLLATLTELHRELTDIGPLDDDSRQQLQETLTDIQQALATTKLEPLPVTGNDNEPEGPLSRRLSDVARDIETTHPQLSMTLGSVIDALGRMGI